MFQRSWLTCFSVWSQIVGSLANIRSVFADNEELFTALKTYTLRLVSAATEKIGWEFGPKEDFLTGQLRGLLISTAGGAGHKGYGNTPARGFVIY